MIENSNLKNTIKYTVIFLTIFCIGQFIAYKIVHTPPQHEFVIILSIALFYPIIRTPILGLYTVFIILPFTPFFRRIYYLAYDRPEKDPLIIIGEIILAYILLGLFFEFRERHEKDRDISGYKATVLIYFAYLIVRTFAFNTIPLTESIARFKFYGPPVLFFFIGIIYAFHTSHLKRFWLITVIIGVISSIYGIKQLFFGYSNFEQLWFSSISFTTLFIKGIARPFSFFQAPVAFADYAQLSILGVLILSGCSNIKYRIFLLFIPVLFYAALITSVRSSWIGIIASFLFWFLLLRIQGNKKRITLLISIALLFMTYEFAIDTLGSGIRIGSFFEIAIKSLPSQEYLDLFVTDRASAVYNPLQEHSLLSRLVLWKLLLTQTREPFIILMGRGLGALKADSIYFTYLAEFGYPGMIFIITIFILFISRGLRLYDTTTNTEVASLAKGITVMTLVFAIISITGTHIHYFPGDIYFWFWNGVLIKLSAQDTIGPNRIEANETIVNT